LFFFFKQKTAYEIVSGDWSSDVCSSDLSARSASSAACAAPSESSLRADSVPEKFPGI
jgi:hypothetical protein